MDDPNPDFPDNPFMPPMSGRCPVNALPNELLSHIFYLGTFDTVEDDEDDEYQADGDMVRGFWDVADEEDEDGDEGSDSGDDGDTNSDAYSLDHNFAFRDEEDDKAIPSSPSDDSDSESEDEELPFQVLVSHICRHWRTVALGNPALWSTLSFTSRPSLSRADAYLARTQALPLDIAIDCTEDDGEDIDDEEDDDDYNSLPKPRFTLPELESILALIAPHSSRWRSLEVIVSLYSSMHSVLAVLSSLPRAPLLEALQLYHHEDRDDDDFELFSPPSMRTPFCIPFAGDAPKLKDVALFGVHLDWVRVMAVPGLLVGLTDLELAYHAEDVRPSWSDFARALRASPELTTLTLCLSGPAGDPSDWDTDTNTTVPELLELSALKNLVLAYHTPSYLSGLLARLVLPSLTSLALDVDNGDFSSLARQLAARAPGQEKGKATSLLARLENLKIGGMPCDRAAVDVMYSELTNLKSLNLACSFVDEVFFDRLSSPLSSSASTTSTAMYLPYLTSLTTSGISGSSMKKLIQIRGKAGYPLKKVMMSDDDDVSEREVKWFRKTLGEDGFEFFEPSDEEDAEDDDVFELDDDGPGLQVHNGDG